ncbi:cytidine deaminase [Thermocladium modestius]|uniref:cytidine deaminase n=1 Tax=Thermocladium modestius TaxID=62609 RepID=A0A830GYF1_9CREN|nr:cytidine deaminase [Thermocladium modestius]GGP21755.1 cytidine deaminase [Thermocladium modestius]
MDEEELVELAKSKLRNSYAPYSGFRVAALAIAPGGKIYHGNNVENASYGLSMCAERVAIFKAVSEGERIIDTVVVVSDGGMPYPCGACLQVMAEFGVRRVIVAGPGSREIYELRDLLPRPFSPANLPHQPEL